MKPLVFSEHYHVTGTVWSSFCALAHWIPITTLGEVFITTTFQMWKLRFGEVQWPAHHHTVLSRTAQILVRCLWSQTGTYLILKQNDLPEEFLRMPLCFPSTLKTPGTCILPWALNPWWTYILWLISMYVCPESSVQTNTCQLYPLVFSSSSPSSVSHPLHSLLVHEGLSLTQCGQSWAQPEVNRASGGPNAEIQRLWECPLSVANPETHRF